MNGLIGSTRILQKKGLTRKGRGSRGRKRVFGGAWTCYRGCGGSCNTSGRNKPKEAEWAPDSCTEVGALTNSCTGLAFAVRFHFNPSPPPRPILPPSPVALAFFLFFSPPPSPLFPPRLLTTNPHQVEEATCAQDEILGFFLSTISVCSLCHEGGRIVRSEVLRQVGRREWW